MELTIKIATPHSPDRDEFEFTTEDILADGFIGRAYALANYGDTWVEEAWLNGDEGTGVADKIIRPASLPELVEFAQVLDELTDDLNEDQVEMILDYFASIGQDIAYVTKALSRVEDWAEWAYSDKEEWAEDQLSGEIPDHLNYYFDYDKWAQDQEDSGDVTFLSGFYGFVVIQEHSVNQY